MIRSRTRSSSRPGTALDSRARASGSSRPSSDSCGRPSSARVVVGSRSANIIATGSASRRRATNPSACTDAASSHCASSTRHRSGRSSAVAAEQVEHGDGDQEPVRRIARRDAQGDSKRVLLRFWERVEPVEHRRAQPMDPGERQLHLRLDAFDLGDAQARGLPRGVPQQRGLSDARLAADHQDGALTVARLGEHAVEALALACPAEEPQPPDGRHLAHSRGRRRGLSRSARRRHVSRNASTASGGALPTVMPRSRNCRATAGAIAFGGGDADDRASPTDVPRRVLVEQGGAVRRGVDDDVDAPERRDRLGEQALDVEIVGEVGAHGDRRAFRGEDLRDRRLGAALMLEVDDDDRPAPACQPARDLAAGPGGAARDDRHRLSAGRRSRSGRRGRSGSSAGSVQARSTPRGTAWGHGRPTPRPTRP